MDEDDDLLSVHEALENHRQALLQANQRVRTLITEKAELTRRVRRLTLTLAHRDSDLNETRDRSRLWMRRTLRLRRLLRDRFDVTASGDEEGEAT